MSAAQAKPPARCYQGVIPSTIATCSRDGTPNITYLSQVFRIDERHVALSCQFFNKTKQNVLENPIACVQMYDPVTFEVYRLLLRYDHSEQSGPLFDAMSLRIDAIASHTGMAGVFRLLSADVYEVLSCEAQPEYLLPEDEVPDPEALPESRSELRALQLISQRMCRAEDVEGLLADVLATIAEALGFAHSLVLIPDPDGSQLRVRAHHGYGELQPLTVVALGQGAIGTVARDRRILRVSFVGGELRYGRAIRARVEQTRARSELRPEVPLLGLSDAQSQLVLPLLAGERLVGVLAVESREQLDFDDWDEAFLEVVANQVAVALDNALLRAGAAQPAAEAARPESGPAGAPPSERAQASASTSGSARVRRFRFFPHDDCVFVDDEYLIRNVPGRILWKILRAYQDGGRSEFSNRELRLDPSLGLPALRDNLESRLVLLRKRLEQKCPELRLVSTSRGHFKLEASCALELTEEDAGGGS